MDQKQIKINMPSAKESSVNEGMGVGNGPKANKSNKTKTLH